MHVQSHVTIVCGGFMLLCAALLALLLLLLLLVVPCCLLLLLPLLLQGEFVDKLAELIVKTYGASNSISKGDIYHIVDKKKQAYFDDEDDE
jgi:hypothetical protein